MVRKTLKKESPKEQTPFSLLCFKCNGTGKYKVVAHGIIDVATGRSPMIYEKICEECKK